MQGKGIVKFFLIVITIVCLVQYLFLLPTRGVERAADNYAQTVSATAPEGEQAGLEPREPEQRGGGVNGGHRPPPE